MKLALITLTILAASAMARILPSEAVVTEAVAITISIDGEKITNKLILGLFGNNTPKTVENFRDICVVPDLEEGGVKLTYNGSPFHRIIPNFMIQGGDFTNRNGTGGRSKWGAKFNDENFDVGHAKYVISMANAGPNTNGSQFFITTSETPWLDGRHTVFGRLLMGKTLALKMQKQGSSSGKTKTPVMFEECELLTADELATALENEQSSTI